MYLLPLLFSNFHLGLDVPINSVDFSAGTLGRMNARSRVFSRFLNRYSPINFHDRGVLDFYPYTSWTNLNRNQHVVSTTSIDENGYKITINVQQYNPEEITVKVVDNWVIIKGRHEKQDKSNIGSQQFVLRYLLPTSLDIDHITSSTSSDGILTITVPLETYQKAIKIEQTRQSVVSSNNTEQVDAGKVDAGFAGAGQVGVKQTDASSASVGQVGIEQQ